MNYPVEEKVPLTLNERNELAKAILGFGNMKKAVKGSGVSEPTIRHAVGGFNLEPPTREKLRNYLNSLNQPA